MKKIILFIFTIGFLSCSSSFIKQEKNKTIKLNPLIESEIKIGIENDLVIIKFNRSDIINLFERDLEDFFDQRLQTYVDELESLESDKFFDEKKLKGTLPFSEFELKFHELLKSGNAEIILKENNNKLKKIKYKFTRSKLGQEDVYFYKEDGTEFYNITLVLGE